MMIAVKRGAALPRRLEERAVKGCVALPRGLKGGAPPVMDRGTMGTWAVAGAVALVDVVKGAALE